MLRGESASLSFPSIEVLQGEVNSDSTLELCLASVITIIYNGLPQRILPLSVT